MRYCTYELINDTTYNLASTRNALVTASGTSDFIWMEGRVLYAFLFNKFMTTFLDFYILKSKESQKIMFYRRISRRETPKILELEQNDVIEVLIEQTGGNGNTVPSLKSGWDWDQGNRAKLLQSTIFYKKRYQDKPLFFKIDWDKSHASPYVPPAFKFKTWLIYLSIYVQIVDLRMIKRSLRTKFQGRFHNDSKVEVQKLHNAHPSFHQ